MKIPEHIEIEQEPVNEKGYRHKKKLRDLDPKEVTSLDLRLRIRFSKKHYRYHEYKLSLNICGDLILDKVKEGEK